MVDGNQQNGGTGQKLKKGECNGDGELRNFDAFSTTSLEYDCSAISLTHPLGPPLEWSCNLEEKAIAALSTMKCPTQCPTYSPSDKDGPSAIPNGTTGFFDCQDVKKGYEPMGNWLSEMDKNGIDQDPDPNVRVMYGGKNRNYCNLIRYDAYRIGCAEKECDKTKLTFCLTNQPPLQEKDVVYYAGNGACPTGMCYSTTGGCNFESGLCFPPQPSTKPTPTKKESKSVICHYSFLLFSCVEV
ncbi:hypothetical protein ANCCAN_09060 [Ancylostoma caninum]|uniref:SCP domain-containing protein n=1 Tax=Ancylostoma caninum TaxID=29170 RepID=A0A368GKS3_ANCCA|nr:hypothetical protein ANCCAN_09060 [Ancylostoma caninum]